MDDRTVRCARCWRMYREAENGAAACRHHPKTLRDYDRLAPPGQGLDGDFWECCGAQVEEGVSALDLPGCATGRHVEAEPDDPGPVQREVAYYEIGWGAKLPTGALARMQERIRRFLQGAPDESGYLAYLACREVSLLEGHDFPWLLQELANPAGVDERRRLLAGRVFNKENAELVRRLTGVGPP